MYSKIEFLGKLTGSNIKNCKVKKSNKYLALFSGEVDDVYTLLPHINEKLYIATIWGADIKLNDNE